MTIKIYVFESAGNCFEPPYVNFLGGKMSATLFISLKNCRKQCKGSHLKGHCHAIWQLYKKLEGVFASTEFQNL